MTNPLLRHIRVAPKVPNGPELRAKLREYGITRPKAAMVCAVSGVSFDRYTLPPTSKHYVPIPMARWLLLQDYMNKIDQRLQGEKA